MVRQSNVRARDRLVTSALNDSMNLCEAHLLVLFVGATSSEEW